MAVHTGAEAQPLRGQPAAGLGGVTEPSVTTEQVLSSLRCPGFSSVAYFSHGAYANAFDFLLIEI